MGLILQVFVVQFFITQIFVINSYILTYEHVINNNESTQESEIQELFLRSRRTLATTDKEKLWDDGLIPYEVDNVFTEKQRKLIKQGIREWERSTCIKFAKRNPKIQSKYLKFTKLACGCCFAQSTRSKYLKFLSIVNSCDTLVVLLHELGHAVGYDHEHKRPDRDGFVQIMYQNIWPDHIKEFDKLPSNLIDTFNQTYDYYSVMHYPRNSYSMHENLDTIIPTTKIGNNQAPIGGGNRLSFGDVVTTNLLYQCPKCGGTLLSFNGIFGAPINQNNSLVNADRCEWRIRAAEGEKIELHIRSLNIYKSPDCKVDYLELRNGYEADNTVMARYCGNIEAIDIIASNYLLVTYVKTSDKNIYNNFNVDYQTNCGGDIEVGTEAILNIESTNYPEMYPPNRRCTWYFTAPDDHIIAMKVNDFALELSDNCKNDFLEIRDGNDDHSQLIGLYCGIKDSWFVNSTDNKLSLVFVSDEMTEDEGFSAMFLAMPKN